MTKTTPIASLSLGDDDEANMDIILPFEEGISELNFNENDYSTEDTLEYIEDSEIYDEDLEEYVDSD